MSAILVPTGNPGKLREFMHAFSLQNRNCIGLKDAAALLASSFKWQTPVEDRQTFVGNGYRKLSAGLTLLDDLSQHGVTSVLVDDSGLCLPRLNFSPGVHSATLAGEPRDDANNRKALIDLLRNKLHLTDDNKEPAFFVCSLLMATAVENNTESTDRMMMDEHKMLETLEQLEPQIFSQLNSRAQQKNSAAFAYRDTLFARGRYFQVDFVMGFCAGKVGTVEQELLPGEGHGYDAMFFPLAKPEFSFASIPLSEKNNMSHRSEALRALNEWAKFRTVLGAVQELF